MAYHVDHPREQDRAALDKLLIDDYRKNDIYDKPPLTDAQMERYSREAWVAYNEQELPEALVLTGGWNYKLAAPYSRLPERGLRMLGKAGMFHDHGGIYVMSAINHEEGGPLSAVFDYPEARLQGEEAPSVLHVALLRTELADRAFLLGKGFKRGRQGYDNLTWRPNGPPVPTELMTRKK
jgi:hypothetical protein